MTDKKLKRPTIKVILPKNITGGVKSRQNPGDVNAIGTQYREMQIMPFLNESISNLRAAWDMTKLLRHLARIEGPISTAIFNLVQVADGPYTIAAYDANTQQFSPEGTMLANFLANQLEAPYDTDGFSGDPSFTQLRQTLLREVVITNACCAELVLNSARLPDYVQVVGLETLRWKKAADKKYKPAQQVAGQPELVTLDIPNFFVSRGVGDPQDLLPRSIMESAIKLLIYFEEVLEDMRRSLRQTGYARNVVTLDIEKIKAAAPRDVLNDTVKFQAFCESVRSGVEETLKDVAPEDALVMFDLATFKIESSNYGKKVDYTPLLNSISGMYATSMKTPPTVLGMRMDSGSQALGNVETLIFLKAAAAIEKPVETQISRILTMGCRLHGANVTVKFKYDPVNIRPVIETEAFTTMYQTRILELLSLGFLTDEEAALYLKTGPRAPDAPKLSGTLFSIAPEVITAGMPGSGVDENGVPVPDPNKQTPGGNSKQPKAGDTPMGKTLQPPKSAPRKAGGRSQ